VKVTRKRNFTGIAFLIAIGLLYLGRGVFLGQSDALLPATPEEFTLLKEAIENAEKGHPNQARALFDRLFEEEREHALKDDALFNWAQLEEKEGEPRKALVFYEKLTMEYPGSEFAALSENRIRILKQEKH